jgi:anaerobic ribonucleoside-triphosphate reductase activating protein
VSGSRHSGSAVADRLRLARVIERTEALGPGVRAVVLVQGCHLRCHGCIAAETHSLAGGWETSVSALAGRLRDLPIDGITCSGGEPFLQAAALARLIDLLRRERPQLSAMSYTGYRIERLRSRGSDAQRALLARLDLLVDGPYVERWHRPLRWRGSTNQRLLALTERHAGALEPDVSAGVELSVSPQLELSWVGVPPQPGFADEVARFTVRRTRGAER